MQSTRLTKGDGGLTDFCNIYKNLKKVIPFQFDNSSIISIPSKPQQMRHLRYGFPARRAAAGARAAMGTESTEPTLRDVFRCKGAAGANALRS